MLYRQLLLLCLLQMLMFNKCDDSIVYLYHLLVQWGFQDVVNSSLLFKVFVVKDKKQT